MPLRTTPGQGICEPPLDKLLGGHGTNYLSTFTGSLDHLVKTCDESGEMGECRRGLGEARRQAACICACQRHANAWNGSGVVWRVFRDSGRTGCQHISPPGSANGFMPREGLKQRPHTCRPSISIISTISITSISKTRQCKCLPRLPTSLGSLATCGVFIAHVDPASSASSASSASPASSAPIPRFTMV